MSDDLKPCPFCGSDFVLMRWDEDSGHHVACEPCGARVMGGGNSINRATTAWNTRADTKRIAALKAKDEEGRG